MTVAVLRVAIGLASAFGLTRIELILRLRSEPN